jgi:hypothetical protein
VLVVDCTLDHADAFFQGHDYGGPWALTAEGFIRVLSTYTGRFDVDEIVEKALAGRFQAILFLCKETRHRALFSAQYFALELRDAHRRRPVAGTDDAVLSVLRSDGTDEIAPGWSNIVHYGTAWAHG